MGCGASSLTGDSFDSISATSHHQVHKTDVYQSPSSYSSVSSPINADPYRQRQRSYGSTSASRPDPTKMAYASAQHVEPLRDAAPPPSTDAGRLVKAPYRDWTAGVEGGGGGGERTVVEGGAREKIADRKERQVRMHSWSERRHKGEPEPRDPRTGKGLFTDMTV